MVSRLLRPAAVMMTMIQAMPDIETMGMALWSHPALPLNILLNMIPPPMGMITILMISPIMLSALILTKAPASHFIRNGVTKGASRVLTAVIVIDSARLALARYEM